MKSNKISFLIFSFYFVVVSGMGQATPGLTFVSSTRGVKDSLPVGYVPPLVSNGSLSMMVDYTGCQNQKNYWGMTLNIYWAGRRYGPPRDGLISFGRFDQTLTINGQNHAVPTSWSQTLDKKNAEVICVNDFGNDLAIETVVFTHLFHDMIVIKKRFLAKSPGNQKISYTFRYQLSMPGKENTIPWRMISTCSKDEMTGGVKFRFETDAYKPAIGLISLFSDKPTEQTIDKQLVSLNSTFEIDLKKPYEIIYFLIYTDTMDGDDFNERAIHLEKMVLTEGYSGLEASHRSAWGSYWDESYIKLPHPRLEEVYNTAQYHLRVNATKWSFPVGIYSPSHWNGRYFGWDEMFCYQALASSNHLTISKRCPEFRFSVLPKAQNRVAHYSKPDYGARYPWETLEDGIAGAPQSFGFWADHVFHMSNIANSAWLQFLYNGDRDYLKSIGYPVIRECARFFVSHMVYENSDGSMFIGKCTDLERLGPARQNPFMTSCGAIFNLECAAKAAEILQVDTEESARWKHIASRLRESLPHEDGRYIPYAGCKEKSVASLGGLFPYPLFDAEIKLQRHAAYDFIENGRASGNMYPVGNAVCPWYAGWMAAALALLGDRSEPEKLLIEAAGTAGCFGDLFEINEPGSVVRTPWFSTASGNVVYAMNQMLVQSKDSSILIAPAVPLNWKDFSFRLACYGNLTAEVKVEKGQMTKLMLIPGNSKVETTRTIFVPEQYLNQKTVKKMKYPVSVENGTYRLDVRFTGETDIMK